MTENKTDDKWEKAPTPRTDAFEGDLGDGVEFCRQLERELALEQERVKYLAGALPPSEYGAYRCFACEARWGALPGNPKMPEECAMHHLNQEPLDFAAAVSLMRVCRAELTERNLRLYEALALLRELNDALVIPGWLQPRVDAVLDGAEEKS